MGEMKRAGRKARLTDDQIAEIRASNEKGDYLASRYGVCHQTISKIRAGKLYSRIPGTGKVRVPMFSADDIRGIRARRAEGMTYKAIAELAGCSEPMVQAICSGRAYQHVQ